MADTQEKYRTLVERLYQKTAEDQIAWEIDWNNQVVTSVADHTVVLKFSRDGDGEPLELVELKNSSDEIIDTFSDTFIGGSSPNVGSVNSYYELMGLLRREAKRKALGVDKAVDTILDKLA